MYDIDESIKWRNHSWMYNTREYIMRHHTAHSPNSTTKNVANFLAFNKSNYASAHFVIGTKYDKKIYQLYDTKAIAHHAGQSAYKWKTLLNQ